MRRDLQDAAALDASVDSDDAIRFGELVAAMRRDWRWVTFFPLCVGVATLAATFLIPPQFTAKALLMPPQQQQSLAAAALQSLGALGGLAGAVAPLRSPADQYVALMQSDNALDRLIAENDLHKVYDKELRSEVRERLASRSRIEVNKKNGLIQVEVDDTDPKRAAQLANGYVEQLRRLTSELAVSEAQQRRKFFEGQLAQVNKQLAAAQGALQAAGLNEGVIRAEPKAAAESYARLRAQLTAAEVRLQTKRAFLADGSAELAQSKEEIAALRSQLSRLEATLTGSNDTNYLFKYRDAKYYEALFEIFAKQFELARVDEAREGALIQVIDPAEAPDVKSGPKRLFLAVLVGLLALIGAFFVIATRLFLRKLHSLRGPEPTGA
jgi:uncharacterized protein involved in exopolysaccharide biosynthesis